MPRLMCAPETAQEALEVVHFLDLAAQLLRDRPARELTDDVDEAAAIGALAMLMVVGRRNGVSGAAPSPGASPRGEGG